MEVYTRRGVGNMYHFESKLFRYQGSSAWYFLPLPKVLAEKIEQESISKLKPFGSFRVSVCIKNSSYTTSIFKDTKSKTFFLPVKKEIRQKELLDDGDMVTCTLSII